MLLQCFTWMVEYGQILRRHQLMSISGTASLGTSTLVAVETIWSAYWISYNHVIIIVLPLPFSFHCCPTTVVSHGSSTYNGFIRLIDSMIWCGCYTSVEKTTTNYCGWTYMHGRGNSIEIDVCRWELHIGASHLHTRSSMYTFVLSGIKWANHVCQISTGFITYVFRHLLRVHIWLLMLWYNINI